MRKQQRILLTMVAALWAGGCEELRTTGPSAFAGQLTLSGPQQLFVGEAGHYALTATTSDGSSSMVIENITWRSSDSGVLSNGLVDVILLGSSTNNGPTYAAKREGRASVIAFYGGRETTLSVIVIAAPSAVPDPPAVPAPPELPAGPPRNESPSGLTAANGEYSITGTASPDPCTGFPLTYVGTLTISGVRDDGTGGSGLLRKNGVTSPYGSNVTVRREGTGFVIEFTARLAINGGFYDYTMRWNLDTLTPGARYTGTHALSGPCSSQGTVSGSKAPG